MPEKLSVFDAADYIRTEEDARRLLEAAADEDSGDGTVIRAVLTTIARAQNMSGLVHEAGLDRGDLDEELSENGNPPFATVLKVIRALGLRLRLEPVEKMTEKGCDPYSPKSRLILLPALST